MASHVLNVGRLVVLPIATMSIEIVKLKCTRGMLHYALGLVRCKAKYSSYLEELAAENQRLRGQLSQSPAFLTPREHQAHDEGI